MAERPDLEYVIPILTRELRGRTIAGVRVKKPVVLRAGVPGGPEAALVGRAFGAVSRRAHFAVFALSGGETPVTMVVAPMLAGRFVIAKASEKSPGDLAVALVLDDGRELRYRDDVQMGKVYLMPADKLASIPGYDAVGLDALDPRAFTREAFRALAKKRRDQVRVFLMDKSALDSLGNAYADETLFEAKIHPKTWVRDLSPSELDALHDAVVGVLTSARTEIEARKPATDVKLRDFLRVRNRAGEPCPRCGTAIRKAGVLGFDAFFCPMCQPETRRTGIVDWRKLPGK